MRSIKIFTVWLLFACFAYLQAKNLPVNPNFVSPSRKLQETSRSIVDQDLPVPINVSPSIANAAATSIVSEESSVSSSHNHEASSASLSTSHVNSVNTNEAIASGSGLSSHPTVGDISIIDASGSAASSIVSSSSSSSQSESSSSSSSASESASLASSDSIIANGIRKPIIESIVPVDSIHSLTSNGITSSVSSTNVAASETSSAVASAAASAASDVVDISTAVNSNAIKTPSSNTKYVSVLNAQPTYAIYNPQTGTYTPYNYPIQIAGQPAYAPVIYAPAIYPQQGIYPQSSYQGQSAYVPSYPISGYPVDPSSYPASFGSPTEVASNSALSSSGSAASSSSSSSSSSSFSASSSSSSSSSSTSSTHKAVQQGYVGSIISHIPFVGYNPISYIFGGYRSQPTVSVQPEVISSAPEIALSSSTVVASEASPSIYQRIGGFFTRPISYFYPSTSSVPVIPAAAPKEPVISPLVSQPNIPSYELPVNQPYHAPMRSYGRSVQGSDMGPEIQTISMPQYAIRQSNPNSIARRIGRNQLN